MYAHTLWDDHHHCHRHVTALHYCKRTYSDLVEFGDNIV